MKLSVKIVSIAIAAVILPGLLVGSSAPEFKFITVENVSRYTENRIAFQHVDKFIDSRKDNSQELLLIIRDSKMQLIMDGYDNPKQVMEQRLMYDMERRLYDDEKIWENKINGKPDAIIVTDRRVPVMRSFKEEFVTENFGEYYSNIRNTFIQRHVNIFRSLMVHRKDSDLYVKREPLPRPFHLGAPEDSETKYMISATAKTSDGRIYYCEDADGDGVTETFSVNLVDGFNWGYKSGPNIIFIYKNKSEAIREIIGTLAENAYYGTDTEMDRMEETISEQREEITDWIEQDLVPHERFYE
ncbi:MAG: hypothetical protein ACOC2H_11170 [Spirochaetota bacterium]